MNSVIGMLFHCYGFRTEMINYHRSDKIADIDLFNKPKDTHNDVCLVNGNNDSFEVLVCHYITGRQIIRD